MATMTLTYNDVNVRPLIGILKSTRRSKVSLRVNLSQDDPLVIGRTVEGHGRISNAFVSGLHFRLYSQRATDNSSQVSIVDECSLNGTAVNGQLLTPSVPRKLVNMDRISICEADGNVILECIFTQYKTDTFRCLFEKREKLGSGGFGKVHEYRERQTGALFAVKRLKHDGMRLADETDAIEKEIRVAKSLKHRTIIKLYKVYCENDKTYMLMEIAPAGSLLQYIIRLGALEERSAQFVFMDIVHALQYLHDERHLIHRDIKPGNILLMSTSPFRAKLGDFGLCRLIDRNNEMSFVGTRSYMPPEVPSGRYSFSADVWSMGAVLYTMMTGKKPFPDGQLVFKDGTVVDTRAPMPSFKNVSGITQNSYDLIVKMMQREPGDRPATKDLMRHCWMRRRKPEVTPANPKLRS